MAKKLYDILDENDYVQFAQWFEEGEQPENAVPSTNTELMAKAWYNRATGKYENHATPEEQAALLARFETDTYEETNI